ncbi:cathepsin L 2 precursor, putative [Acanthamoeba castellanii str. Neff]|uniref:Cathepsin L 2, putative n=1 Tax=Acanthamoeba castellanii (strain ATCC 30010 / Neff) TaxID=1257118 RepID=L8HH53_ACACF|nr:cathepsin L 2 precursor, putative [Acanthamoeba castellanii str. Neff]ELR24500.1 cathepsin L 2 precursor, putative [Acanthamoeba castellanii str. Neff]
MLHPTTALLLALSVAVFLVASAAADKDDDHEPIRRKFLDWMTTHNKSYVNPELAHRWNVWRENYRFIEEHNRQNRTYSLGMNQFGDLTFDDYKALYTVTMPPFNASNYDVHNATSSGLARRNVDWRNQNCVQRVKNQGSCESNYAFAAIGALETAYCLKHDGYLADMSEQHLVDCGGRGCSGGWMHDMFAYLQRSGGTTFQSEYPYTGRVGTCQAQSKRKVAQVESHKMIRRGDENDLMQALSTVGTIAIAYNAGTQAHAYYRSGVLDVPGCGNTPTHAVLLVGYGNEGGKDYWLLKNSWGTSWGEAGYFKLVRGKNMCGIADWASYPVVV